MDNEEKGRCGVIGIALAGLALLALVVLLVNGLAQVSDSETSRMYAQQALVIAQGQADAARALAAGQARLDSAEAFAITAGASLPWLVMGVVGVSGAALMGAIVAMFSLAMAAIRGQQPALPGPGRILVIDRPGRLALPELQEPGRMTVITREEAFDERQAVSARRYRD